MNVVFEGCDAAGKSTLIAAVNSALGHRFFVQPSEGPPKFPGEMVQRVERYLSHSGVIFDRHPCVSQPIYGMLRGAHDPIPQPMIDAFYARAPLFIYCRPRTNRLENHEFNEGVDSEAHLHEVEQNYAKLLAHYELWARRHAHITYTLGRDFELTIKIICGAIENVL